MKYLQLLISFRSHRFFDVFEYNALEKHWGCFLCNHPDRAHNFVQVMNMIPNIVSEKTRYILYLPEGYIVLHAFTTFRNKFR